MEGLIQSILEVLRPSSIGDIIIYLIIIILFVTTIVLPDKNDQANFFLLAALFASFLDLLRGSDGQLFAGTGAAYFGGGSGYLGFGDSGFATLLLHVVMAIGPFIAAGLMRIRTRRGRMAVPLSILAGIIGSLYALGAFFAPETFYAAVF